MVTLQIISKILNTKDYRIIEDNLITSDYFVGTGYESEFEFIESHHALYNNVPDKATFLSKFPDIELVDVEESDEYLVKTFREEYLYRRSVPVIRKAAELLKSDSNSAAEYLVSAMRTLEPNYGLGGVDIISNAIARFDGLQDRMEHQDDWYFTSGFEELDEITHGIQRGEELFVIFARTNQGKSWVLEKMITHIWQLGFNVGYISPEMSADSVGYRFDTLYNNFSNKSLVWGNNIDINSYKEYIDNLKSHNNKFIVSTPLDFDRQITVSKLRKFIKQYKLDAIAIDGITYMTDERGKRGDNKTTSLTNISEDLMMLSVELNVPILVVVQANRSGVVEEDKGGTPELESIRDSDGISHNASKVLSIRQDKEGTLELGIKKQRFGAVGGKLRYHWNIDIGEFTFIPEYDDAQPTEKTEEQINRERTRHVNKTDVF